MNEGALFLVQTLFNLYIMAVVLRIWLQLARADFFNPLSQFVARVTNPLIKPLERVIPSKGRLNLAAVLLGIVLSIIAIYVRGTMMGANIEMVPLMIVGVLSFVSITLQLMFWIIFIRAILSWFSQGGNPLELVMHQLTEPLLRPVRRVIPAIGGLDLSVLFVLLGIQFLRILIGV
ncbi:MAG: YggT family protein [Idiomarina sp.]|nr:YggT family protein [Idiomarina sp.]